jgi:hypothetical protein
MVDEKESSQLSDNFLFPKIFRAFRMAIQPSKLIIGLLAVAAIFLAGWIMDLNKTVVTTPDTQGQETELQVYMTAPDRLQPYIDNARDDSKRVGVFATLWRFGVTRCHGALYSLFRLREREAVGNIADYLRAVIWAFRYHPLYCIIFAVIKLAVLSIAGGAICRIAALQFAQDERPGMNEALRFSTRKFRSFFSAPLAPIGIIIFIGLFIFVLGLLGNIQWVGELLIGIFMPLTLIAGALIAVVSIGAVAGFNLMFPAIAYDDSDCFDATSRAFSYIYARPWRMGFYTVVAAIYGTVCYMFVRFFAFLVLWLSHRPLQLGILGDNSKLAAIWPEPTLTNLLTIPDFTAGSWTQSVAAFLVYIFVLAVVALVASFVISFYFSANTIIYALMRNRVDNTALDDVHTYPDESEAERTAPEPESEASQPQPEPKKKPDSDRKDKPDSPPSTQ